MTLTAPTYVPFGDIEVIAYPASEICVFCEQEFSECWNCDVQVCHCTAGPGSYIWRDEAICKSKDCIQHLVEHLEIARSTEASKYQRAMTVIRRSRETLAEALKPVQGGGEA